MDDLRIHRNVYMTDSIHVVGTSFLTRRTAKRNSPGKLRVMLCGLSGPAGKRACFAISMLERVVRPHAYQNSDNCAQGTHPANFSATLYDVGCTNELWRLESYNVECTIRSCVGCWRRLVAVYCCIAWLAPPPLPYQISPYP